MFGDELYPSKADTNVVTNVNRLWQRAYNHRLPLELAGFRPSAPERPIAPRRVQNAGPEATVVTTGITASNLPRGDGMHKWLTPPNAFWLCSQFSLRSKPHTLSVAFHHRSGYESPHEL